MTNSYVEMNTLKSPQLACFPEWIELGLKFAASAPEQNIEGRWIFAYVFESMNNQTFQIKCRNYIFYTLGMDGIDE